MMTFSRKFKMGQREIGEGCPVYVVAEMSANHNQSLDEAIKILHEAKSAGADAVKIQTYTPDTMTLNIDSEVFKVAKGTLWEGKKLYDLYQEAHTPWEWHAPLHKEANKLDLHFFSTPFDDTAVDFLEKLDTPAYKVASFEIVDLPLIEKITKTGKPIIMSTGMASQEEITEAVDTVKNAGGTNLILLKCTSAYPAPLSEMNLLTIPDMQERFGLPVGLSDHTMGIVAPIVAVGMGMVLIEKHFTLSRAAAGPDNSFSLEPAEFKEMVDGIRSAEAALGRVTYEVSSKQKASQAFRRSLFVVKDMKAGDAFTHDTVRSLRPADGLPPKNLSEVLTKTAACDIRRGTPLSRNLLK